MKSDALSFVFLSTMDWDDLWVIQRTLSTEIGKTNKILFVERFVSFFSLFFSREYRNRVWNWLTRKKARGLRKIEGSGNLFVYTPPLGFHLGHKFPFLYKMNYVFLSYFIRKVIKRLELQNVVVFTEVPFSTPLIRRIKTLLSIYYIIDEPKAFEGTAISKVVKAEDELLKDVDLVFAVSNEIVLDKMNQHKKCFEIRNGIDMDRFSKSNIYNPEIELLFKSFERPIIGFIGVIKEWVDLELISYISDNIGSGTLVMVGPVDAGRVNIGDLKKKKNVQFLGSQSGEKIPSMINQFDICLIPFIKNELTKNADPLKLYEYLALGKIVVSTNISSYYESLKDLVYVANSQKEFLFFVRNSLNLETKEKMLNRIRFAENCSLQNRWQEMKNIIINEIEKKYHS